MIFSLMSGERSATLRIDPSEEGSVSQHHSQQGKIKLMLFLLSLAFSVTAFLTFDYLYSAAIRRTHASTMMNTCSDRDPVRYCAFKPNCACIERWGRDSYELVTNNLGFRDEKIRQVPLTDVRPRILMLGNSFTEGKIAWHDSYVGRIAARFRSTHSSTSHGQLLAFQLPQRGTDGAWRQSRH